MNRGQVYLDSTTRSTPKRASQPSPRAHREHKNALNVIRSNCGVNLSFGRPISFFEILCMVARHMH